jgi:arginine/serine-rich splicing factor 12
VQAAQKRADEVARTVYVGNLSLETGDEPIKKFFLRCGTVLHVKLAGDNTMGRTGRFAFVEFDTKDAAEQALTMSGGLIGDRVIKVGRSNNPIFKPGGAEAKGKPSGSSSPPSNPQAELLEKIKAYTAKLSEKVERKEERERRKKGSRSRSRGRSKKSKHRRRSRSRSRSRGRRSRRSRRSRSRSRSISPLPPLHVPPKKKVDRTGMFFDGYNWQPIDEAAQKLPSAMLMAQYAAASSKK